MEGARMQKAPGGRKRSWIVLAAVLAVLLCAYLGLCAWAGAQGVLPNVTAGGLDLSGMSEEQAALALEEAAAQAAPGLWVELRYGDWSGTLTGEDVEVDCQRAVRAAWAVGRDSFFLQGAGWLAHRLGITATETELDISLTPSAQALLDEADREEGSVTGAQYMVEGEALVVTKGVTGVAVDRAKAGESISAAFRAAFAAAFAGGSPERQTVELSGQEAAPGALDFEAIHQELYTQARDAQVDPETYQATDHVVGVDFDAARAQAMFDAAGEGETISIPLTLTQPAETKESLQAKLFRDVLGEATSNVSGSAVRKNNVKLAAGACNGIVLMPGEEFSYNTATGERTADKGYGAAPSYVAGESVDNVGGGVCQPSSTIYYAVLHTTLEVTERHDHQFAVGYVPDGMDATVWYGALDFKFKNNTDYPVKVVTESYDQGGRRRLTVKIYGTNEDGHYVVPRNEVFDWVAPTTQYKPDETVPQGTTRVDTAQNPYNGRKARTYRYVYDKDGNLLEKQDMGLSTYAMRPETVYYNPADGDPATWVDGVPGTGGQTSETVNPDPGGQTGPEGEGQTGTEQPADPGTEGGTGQPADPGTETGEEQPAGPDGGGQTETEGAGGPDAGGEQPSPGDAAA